MGVFSPFVTLAGLKSQPGAAVRVLQKRSCNYMIKISARFAELKFQPAFIKLARISSSFKRAKNFHVIANIKVKAGLKLLEHAHSKELLLKHGGEFRR